MKETFVAYWPVACDLKLYPSNHITVGRETQIACDAVISHCRSSLKNDSYIILPAAGISPDSIWRYRVMAHVMAEYFREKGVRDENIEPLKGQSFDTQGEAYAIAEYLKEHPLVQKVVISVKWWHALRCYTWLQLYFKKLSIKDVEIEVLPTHSHVDISTILFEFWKAIPYNLIRMLKVRYFG